MRLTIRFALCCLPLCTTPLLPAQQPASSAPTATAFARASGACPSSDATEAQVPWKYSSPATASSPVSACTTAPAAAQQAAVGAVTTTVQLRGHTMEGCPVSMTAERQAYGQRKWIIALEDGDWMPHTVWANRAGVHVQIESAKDRSMREAEVVVYYMAPGIHALPLSGSSGGSPINLRKTFILSPADSDPTRRLTGSLLVGPAASITRVSLLSITYSDGSTWGTELGNQCSAPLGLLMAVAER